jgi:cytochrome P450
VNTVPMSFWFISFLFADKQLLADVRREIDGCTSTSAESATKHVINATSLRTSCPWFMSAMRETLRVVSGVNIMRAVAQDVNLTNSATGETYLLKKDSIVQIASNVIHQRPFWGKDYTDFNPRRFMQSNEKAKAESVSGKIPDPAAPFRDEQGKVQSAAFRSFGGGNNICPGRHFAQTEILAFAALFAAGFEIENADTPGEDYKMPTYEDFKLSLATVKPANDVDVTIRRRSGFEDVEWGLEM